MRASLKGLNPSTSAFCTEPPVKRCRIADFKYRRQIHLSVHAAQCRCHPGTVREVGRCNHPPRDVWTESRGPCAWPDGLARKMACEVRERSSVGCIMIRRLLVHTVYNPDVAFTSRARSGLRSPGVLGQLVLRSSRLSRLGALP